MLSHKLDSAGRTLPISSGAPWIHRKRLEMEMGSPFKWKNLESVWVDVSIKSAISDFFTAWVWTAKNFLNVCHSHVAVVFTLSRPFYAFFSEEMSSSHKTDSIAVSKLQPKLFRSLQ